MQRGIVSRAAVLQAMAEYDSLGPDRFLELYGFGRARDYVLVFEGREYDSKAIVGVAHKYEYGQALLHDQFSGGKQEAAAWLKRLGFVVRQVRNPNWTWDESVLACALVVRNDWKGIPAEDPRVHELSALLQLMSAHDETVRSDTFRNTNGVARKTYDLATNHPDYPGRPTNAGKTDRGVIQAFITNPANMLDAARHIRDLINSEDFEPVPPRDDDPDDEFEAPEGRLLLRQHLRRERNPKLKGKKIKSVQSRGGNLACEVCDFDFEQAYGERGAGYVECHHIVPLHIAGEGTTKLSDLALICSNCHRMIHRRAPWPTPAELRSAMPPRAAAEVGRVRYQIPTDLAIR
jgi:5-methylcytosine-specific restriction protein A